MDLMETGCEGVDWIQLIQGRDQWQAVLNTVVSLWVWLSLWLSFSGRTLLQCCCKGKVVPVLLLSIHSFFDLGTRCRWVVSFTPWLLYPQGKSPWYPFDRLGGPQSHSGCGGEEKNSQPLPETR